MQPYIKFFAFYSKDNLIQARSINFDQITRQARRQAAKRGAKLSAPKPTFEQQSTLSMKAAFEKQIAEIKKMPTPTPEKEAQKKKELADIEASFRKFKEEFKEHLKIEDPNEDDGIDDSEDDCYQTGDVDVDYERLYEMGQVMQLSTVSMVTCADFERDTKQLHQLARVNNIAQMKMRLNAGCDVDEVNDLKRTPLDYAIAAYQLEAVKFLVENGASLDFGGRIASPLHYAAGVGDEDIFHYLLKQKGSSIRSRDPDGDLPLHYACAAGNLNLIEDLAGKFKLVNVNTQNKLGNTPLHYACVFGHVEVVKKLFDLGASPSLKNKEGLNCFHLITDKERIDKCTRTVRDTDSSNKRSNTPRRDFPDTSAKNYAQVVQLLIQHGGRVNDKNPKGRSPLGLAIDNQDANMIDMWLQAGADPNASAHDTQRHNFLTEALGENLVSIAHKLLDYKIDTKKSKTMLGLDSIYLAVSIGDPKLVAKMLKTGVQVNALDEECRTPLHYAASLNYQKSTHKKRTDYNSEQLHPEAFSPSSFNFLNTAHVLIENGAYLEARDKSNLTPLLHAARVGDFDMLDLLLSHGADITALTSDGLNALHLVCQLGEDCESFMHPTDEVFAQRGAKIKLIFNKKKNKDQKKIVPRFLLSAKILIHYGVDVNEICNFGRAPLFIARKKTYKPMIRLLEENKAKDRATELYHMFKNDMHKLSSSNPS